MEKSGDIDLLTETDQQVERKLIDGLSAQFPTHKYHKSVFNIDKNLKL